MQDYHLEVGNAEHRGAGGILASYTHIVNLSLAVVQSVNSQFLISLSLSEGEDTSLKPLIIGAVSILGVKVIDDIVRLAWSERLPSDVLLLI